MITYILSLIISVLRQILDICIVIIKSLVIFILKVITFPYVIYWAFLKHPDEPWRWVWKAYWDNCRVWMCILAVAVSGFIGIELGNVLKLGLDTLDKWGEEEYIKRDSLRQDKARMETYDISRELHDGSAE